MSGILRQLKNTLAETAYAIDSKNEADLWNALSEAIDQIEKLAKIAGHRDRCSMLEWSDEAHHIPTKWGFVITADECSCGAIQTITDLLFMTNEDPRTYTLTEQQRALVSEALTMLAAQRYARRVNRTRDTTSAGNMTKLVSEGAMEVDQMKELTALRALFKSA